MVELPFAPLIDQALDEARAEGVRPLFVDFGLIVPVMKGRVAAQMPRKLRIQYEGALYHVLNLGNDRRDVFESAGAAQSLIEAMEESSERYDWLVHAYVLMRNHSHLIVETPKVNLVDGMHGLESTVATRFNRFRNERGHLFPGRYQAILLEDFSIVARVADYIHLNPVRAGIVTAEQTLRFRWSSLPRFVKTGVLRN